MANEFKYITVNPGQSMYDIAVQEYGCYEGVFLLIVHNPTVLVDGLDTELSIGASLAILKTVPSLTANNVAFTNYIAGKGVRVISGNQETISTI